MKNNILRYLKEVFLEVILPCLIWLVFTLIIYFGAGEPIPDWAMAMWTFSWILYSPIPNFMKEGSSDEASKKD